MIKRIFLVINKFWKEYTQPGEVTREGTIPTSEALCISKEGNLFFLNISDTFKMQISKEDSLDLQVQIDIGCKTRVKIIHISGRFVKAEIIIKDNRYLVSLDYAERLLDVCSQPIQSYSKYLFGIKKSSGTNDDPQIWWVKEYSGPYTGIYITGVELKDENEELYPPDWVGKEISGDPDSFDADILLVKPTAIEQALGVTRY